MKNTRRFIAGFSAMAMAAAMAMSASAVDPAQIVPDADGQPTPETAGAEVTYNVDPSYTVTIPAGADISSGSDEQTITASDVLLEQGKKITVTLSKASNTASGKLFTAKDESGESTVNYTIKAGDADVEVGGTVAEFETKTGEQSATLTFTKDADSTPTYAGKHTETLTFNISVESASTPVTAITLNKTETTIVKGSDETLSVTAVTPDNATDKTVTWSSDEESVATVDADGKVTAVAAGTANITATANDGSGVTATCVVTVAPLYYDKAVQVYRNDNPGYRDYVYYGNYKTLSADEGYALAQYFASVNSCSVCVITDWIDSSGQMKYVTNSSSAEQQSTPSFFGRYDRVYLVPKN